MQDVHDITTFNLMSQAFPDFLVEHICPIRREIFNVRFIVN